MTMAEAVDLSARVHVPSLMADWKAVGGRTADLVAALRPSDLDQVVSSERVRHAVTLMAAGPGGAGLQDLWQDTTTGHFLVWLLLTHTYEHIGQADLIRGLLGRPGRFQLPAA